jgi:lysophospholipase L1-like esterase
MRVGCELVFVGLQRAKGGWGVTYRRRCLLPIVGVVAALSLLFLAGPIVAPASAASATPAPSVLYFVHLGDIWRYDVGLGVVEVVEPADGRCIGHLSWSADGTALAWEEKTFDDGRELSRVFFRRQSSTPSGQAQVADLSDATSPAVSPDGRYLLYEKGDGGAPSLAFFDSEGGPVPSPLAGARNGAWARSSDGDSLLVAFDREDGSPSGQGSAGLGFYLLDFVTGRESQRTVTGAETAGIQRGRWAPLADPLGTTYLVTRFATSGRTEILRTGDTVAATPADPKPILDVTNVAFFDYRWLQTIDGSGLPYVEVVPMAGGRSDIYEVKDASDGTAAGLALLDASFGWNASFPSVGPFSDLGVGQSYFQAAALLWAQRVVSGFPDGGFHSEEPVKRAQFAKMLAGAVGLEVYRGLPKPPFPDVGENVAELYPSEFVSAASGSRLVRGYADGLFRPWGNISRAQMITMVVRAARAYLPQGLSEPPDGWIGQTWGYTDPAHGYAVHLAEYAGLLDGIDLQSWDPAKPAQRGEVAQLLVDLQRLRSPLADVDHPPAYSMGAGGLRPGVEPAPGAKQSIGNIVFDGDSLTAGSTATDPYPSQVMRVFHPEVYWVNLGIGGQKLSDMLANAPAKVDPLYQAKLGRNVVVIWGGTNDMRHWNHSPAAVYEHLRQYCLGRRTQGYTVVVMTLLPRTDTGYPESFESNRQQVNAMIRRGWTGFADALVDVGSDPFIGLAGREIDPRFYSPDRVHLNNGGLAVVAGQVHKLLQRVDALANAGS